MDKLGFSWLIPDKIAGHAEPTSSQDVAYLLQLGVRALVRMRETGEAAQFHRTVREGAMEDLHVPVEDFTPPTQEELSTFVAFIEQSIAVGRPVAVSCYSGKGRTGTVLAAYLVNTGKYDAEDAIKAVRQARPNSIECHAQESAIHEFADRKIKGKLPAYRKELIALAALGQEYDFGSNGWDVKHSTQVGRLSLNLLKELVRLGIHVEQDTDGLVLEGAALLHDIGRNPKADGQNSEPHHERSFKTLKTRLLEQRPDLLPGVYEAILYCVLFHSSKSDCQPRDGLVLTDQARKLASLLRIADALDYQRARRVREVSLCLVGARLTCSIRPWGQTDTDAERGQARSKKGLFVEVYSIELDID